MSDIATIRITADIRPAKVNGRYCLVHMTLKSAHGGFVVEDEDGSISEAVPGIDGIRFIDSADKFEEICWEVKR